MTLGMHIDRLIASIDSLSSTTLYALIVGGTIFVSLGLLGSAKEGEITVADMIHQQPPGGNANGNHQGAENNCGTSPSNSALSRQPRNGSAVPEPKWQFFRYMNIVILVLFVASVVEFYWNDSLYMFLLGWSVFLCYFFGFFGVTFVHDIATTSEADPPTSRTAASTTAAVKDYAPPSASTAAAPSARTPLDKGCGRSAAPFEKKELENVSCSSSSSFSRDDDQEIIDLVLSNQIKDHELERRLGDCNRAVTIRRQAIQQRVDGLAGLDELPHTHYDYQQVHGTNCEIVVGYVPIPVGLAGPLMVNGVSYHVPMATTEGCLVASTNRGCKAIGSAGGATAVVMQDAITRAPCVRMPTASQAAALKIWCQDPGNFELLRTAFESTTSFGKLVDLQVTVAGKNAYLRLSCFSGDAMGMNMVSKGSLAAIECLRERFPDLQLVALSGNMCTDKKAASTNWIHGRGKSVVAEATIPASIVTSVLKTTVDALVETNLHKNLIGSAMAGTVGGYNAHASNIVTAIFLATGQDPAQNVESSNCITLMEKDDHGDLWISCTMPSLEVGTVGGGTSLQAQAACLKMLSCHGGSKLAPGENSQKLATIVASTVMAGELSLLAALAANTLVQAHMQHNRKKQT